MSRKPKRLETIVAIQPNRGVQLWYWNQLERLIRDAYEDLERELERPAEVALAQDQRLRCQGLVTRGDIFTGDTNIEYTASLAQDAASPNTRLNTALKRWGDRWTGKFDKAANRLAKEFTTRSFGATQTVFRTVLAQSGFTVKFKATRESLEAFRATVSENVGLIKSIQSQYHTKIQGDVWRAVTRGSDLSTLSKNLKQSYGITTKRAALIARDQNAKAKATIENTRRQELGITRAIWQHSSAGKEPRPSHVAMNGKLFDLAKGMFDPDEQQWILPGQLINCRCTSRAVIPGLEE